ncbi:hypothetical protein [Streptomyces sp. NPDC046821]|uniref:hypothetical protein n=1 Tax=Streptomyces sp. NPDC046821 TaxID=3154702 RepID=UPI00340F900E
MLEHLGAGLLVLFFLGIIMLAGTALISVNIMVEDTVSGDDLATLVIFGVLTILFLPLAFVGKMFWRKSVEVDSRRVTVTLRKGKSSVRIRIPWTDVARISIIEGRLRGRR